MGEGAGVVSLRDGKFAGGDSAMIYRGTITHTGNDIEAQVTVARHNQGMQSVLGIDNASLSLKGPSDDTHARLSGSSHGVTLHAELRRAGDL